MAYEAVYEQEFYPCSYGFRPNRSPHQALGELWKGLMDWGGGWLLEVDVQSFFDTLDKRRLHEMLHSRVRDGVLLRLVGKWLKAGVLEEGRVSHPSKGTPQGGVISPLLANVYLHEVLDKWIARSVAPRLKGQVQMYRFADDFILLFRTEADARRVLAALTERFARSGLTVHPTKTRLVEFRQPPYRRRERPRVSFDFLGFTHFWGRSRKGGWIVQRKTARKSLGRALSQVREWCRRNRHLPLREQHRRLSAKLRGHYAYFGLTGNGAALVSFRYQVERAWHKWLSRRSWKSRMSWARFAQITGHYPLPPIRVVHSIYRT
jgi:group II intron reverse transcriptase/maturase